MIFSDAAIVALTIWRENASGGYIGMQSVANVIMNRTKSYKEDFYKVCTTHKQFSSMTVEGQGTAKWPDESDLSFITASGIAVAAVARTLSDITGGATSYYAPSGMSNDEPPYWAASMAKTVTIAGQIFYK